MTLRRSAIAALLAIACGPRRPTLPPRPARCAAETVPGLDTRAVTWSRGRWVAAIPEGARLSLRAFDDRGEPDGSGLELLDAPVRPDGAAIVATESGVIVAAATGALPASVRVLAVEGSTVREAEGTAARTEGPVALVPRPDVPSRPAALFTEEGGATVLRIVSADGSPGPARRCPPGVSPRSVAAWDEGFVALRTADGVSLAHLDASCTLLRDVRVSADAASTRAPSVATDVDGAVAAWTDGESRAWIAGVDHGGALRIRPTALEAGTEHIGLALAPGDRGRAEVRVIALRRNEIQSRLQLYRFDARGVLRDIGGVTTAPAMAATAVAPDPWGGALVGWSRVEPTPAGLGARPTLAFFSRVCP